MWLTLLIACGSTPAPDAPPAQDTAVDGPVCEGLPCDALAPLPEEQPCGAELRAQGGEAPAWPEWLSGLGCFSDSRTLQPGPGVLPYDVAGPLFSEGADKGRWLVLPPGQTLTPTADGEWGMPPGTLILKAFALPGRAPLEVRAMLRTPTTWAFASWGWEDAAGDLRRVPERGGSLVLELEEGSFTWLLPSLLSCQICHRVPGQQVIGLQTSQLHHRVDYGHVRADQLLALDGVGVFSPPITSLPDLPALPGPYGRASVTDRARSWLHANCAHCHQPGGFAPPDQQLDLRASTPFAAMGACMAPKHAGYLTDGDYLIVPGDPRSSHLVHRVRTHTFEKMPPDGGARYDEAGIAAVEAWISGLAGCP